MHVSLHRNIVQRVIHAHINPFLKHRVPYSPFIRYVPKSSISGLIAYVIRATLR